jgi:osmotically-inducible protein OsmY
VQSQSETLPTVVDSSIVDMELARRVAAYLTSRRFQSFRELEVSAAAGVVTIIGSVGSFHEKQVAYQSCRRVAGVREVVDAVYVAPPRFASEALPSLLAKVDSELDETVEVGREHRS